MSHLEPVDVDRVRRAVDRERLENLEEVRLNDTVIRRRSKTALPGTLGSRRARGPPRRPVAGARRARAAARQPRAVAAGGRQAAPERRRRLARASLSRLPRRPSPRAQAEPRPAASRAPRQSPPARVAPRPRRPQPAVPRRRRRRSLRTHGRLPRLPPSPARPTLKHYRAAGRHRLGRDGRVHPAARRAAVPVRAAATTLRDQGSRRGAAPAGPRARRSCAQPGAGAEPVRPPRLRPRRAASGRRPEEEGRRGGQEAQADPDHDARRAQARHPHGRHHRRVRAGPEDGRQGQRDHQEAVGARG